MRRSRILAGAAGKVCTTFLVSAVLLSSCVSAKNRHSAADSTPGSFDYYLLNLSWAPEFCSTHGSNASSSECDPTHHFGLVVHGLWPQNDDGSYPQHCGSAQPVSQDTVRQMLPIMPARGLIQHEWSTHGTCSGLEAQTYFGDIRKAYTNLQVPAQYKSPSQAVSASPAQIEQAFASANHAPSGAFRVSCSGSEFVALEVCLTKDLQYRQCGNSLHDCRAPQVTFEPVR